MAFCSKCGTELPSGAQFCPNCGAAQQINYVQPPQAGANGHPDYNSWYLPFVTSYIGIINAINAQQGVKPTQAEDSEAPAEEPIAEIAAEEVAVEAQPKKGFKLASWPALLLFLFGAALFGVLHRGEYAHGTPFPVACGHRAQD